MRMGYAFPYPYPLYPTGTEFFPFTYQWVKFLAQTRALMGIYPPGKPVMGTHCHP